MNFRLRVGSLKVLLRLSSISVFLPSLPFFVVIRMTPFAALAPYMAEAAASFKTSIDSISFGLISTSGLVGSFVGSETLFETTGNPSTTYSGWLLAEIELVPRILTFIAWPTLPLPDSINNTRGFTLDCCFKRLVRKICYFCAGHLCNRACQFPFGGSTITHHNNFIQSTFTGAH